MTATPCRGDWANNRNLCGCRSCRDCARARWDWIDAMEHVHRLVNRGADPGSIEVRLAEVARDRLGARWERIGAGGIQAPA